MSTTRRVITNALRNLGIVAANSVPTAEDIDIGLNALDVLIDSMSNTLLNIHTINPYRFPMEAGKSEYLLGPEYDDAGIATGAEWIIERPMRIENAVLMVYAPTTGPTELPYRASNDYIGQNYQTLSLALDPMTFVDYSDLTVRKLQTTWPTAVYDNNGYPCRKLTFWPVPQTTVACELWLWQPLAVYETLDEELNLPPGYDRYLTLKLAKEVAADFGAQWTELLESRLKEAESGVKTLNQFPTVARQTGLGRSVVSRTPSYVTNSGKYNRIPRVY